MNDNNNDLLVAGAAVVIALVAIVGTVIVVASGRGEVFGFSPPDATPTPRFVRFGRPACANDPGSEGVIFVNNTTLTLTVSGGDAAVIIEAGEQIFTEADTTDTRYTLQTDDPRYSGEPTSITVPEGTVCRVPIQ